ncbi:MAG TPA: PAS domain S-box protein, partial [Bryobacteraceae bacterium]|nr:PAS domain S-box protein [Bryobacteraceae bacterium]
MSGQLPEPELPASLANEQRLRAIIEQSAAGIAEMDSTGRFIFVKDRYCQVVGWSRCELLARSMQDITHPDDLQRNLAVFETAAREGGSFVIEKRYLRPDLSEVWVSNSVTAIRDARGAVSLLSVTLDISESKRHEAALRASEGRFRFLGEISEASLTIVNRAEIMATISKRLGEHLAVSRCAYADVEPDSDQFTIQHDYTVPGCASTAGKYHLSLFGPRAVAEMHEGRTLVIRDMKRELAPGQGREMFEAIGIEAIVCCPLVKEGRLVAMMAVHQTEPRDWTEAEISLIEAVVERSWAYIERARAERDRLGAVEQELEHRRLLRAITDNAAVALFIADEHHRCVFTNPAGERLTGFTAQELAGSSLHEKLHHTRPDGTSYPSSECPLNSALGRNDQLQGEEVFVHKDGSFYPVAYTSSPMHEGGAHVGTVIEVRDIRARKQAEEALRESEERYRFLSESIPQMVWTAKPDGALDYLSNQVMAYFGMPENLLIGAGWLSGVHPEDQEFVVQRWHHSLTSGEPYETEFRLRRGVDGAWRWFLVRAVPMVGSGGKAVRWFGTCTDIHGQKLAEQQLRLVNADLESFAFAAAHDLQEPLRMVTSYTQLLERRLKSDLDDNSKLFVEHIVGGAKRMSLLLQDLLAYAETARSADEGQSCVDLNECLAAAIENCRTAIDESGAQVTADLLPNVVGHSSQVSQLFQNLISNAVKYRGPKAPVVHVSAQPRPLEWLIKVQDNGLGIAPEHQKHIFGVFKRLHGREIPGTGIGLAICQRVVERLGGRIWVESGG